MLRFSPKRLNIKTECGIFLLLFIFFVTAGLIIAHTTVAAEENGPGLEITESVIMGYLYPEDPEAVHDYRYVTEDVLFMDMATGQPMATNREELAAGLDYIYNVAFDVEEIRDMNLLTGNGEAALEWTLVGTHTGEFAGIPATGRKVEFPIIARYELQEEYPHHIKEARIYIMMNILMDQLLAGGE